MLALRSSFVSTLRLTSVRSISSTSILRSEGAPSGAGQDGFKKREKAEEEKYMRDSEREKLKALRKSIDASKAHLAELENQHKTLESSIPKEDK
ncbi:hypothetical protein JCM5353_003178 [Sporobolomyces roseus]